MKQKSIHIADNLTEEPGNGSRRQLYGYSRDVRFGNNAGTFRNDAKVQRALLNRISELALVKALASKGAVSPGVILNTGLLAPVRNMIKQVQIAGATLTINNSLPEFENDSFIIEKTERANLKLLNKG